MRELLMDQSLQSHLDMILYRHTIRIEQRSHAHEEKMERTNKI